MSRNVPEGRIWGLAALLVVLLVVLGLASPGAAAVALIIGLIVVVALVAFVRAAAWVLYFAAVSCSGFSFAVGGADVRIEYLGLPLLGLMLWRERSGSRSRVNLTALIVVSLTVFGLVGFFSALYVAPEPPRSLWVLTQVILGVGVYLLLSRSRVDKAALITQASAVMGVIASVSLASLALVLAGLPTTSVLGVAPDRRLLGLSFEPNIFACQCAVWLIVLYVYRGRLGWTARCSIPVLLLAVAFAGTRSAWLAVALLGAVILWRRLRQHPLGLAALALAAGAGLVAWPLLVREAASDTESLAWRLVNILNTRVGTGAYRVDIYTTALDDIEDHNRWVFGAGMNAFSQFHLRDATGVGEAYLSSVWYALLYDVGLVGGAAVLVILMAVVWRSGPRLDSALVVAALLVCASSTNNLWFQFPWVYMALLPLYRPPAPSREEAVVPSRARRHVRPPFAEGGEAREPSVESVLPALPTGASRVPTPSGGARR